MDSSILDIIRKKGLLLEKEIYDLINELGNIEVAKNFLNELEKLSGQKLITKNVLIKNVEYVKSFFGEIPSENKNTIERVFVNLGVSLEVVREKEVIQESKRLEKKEQKYRIFYADAIPEKKIEVKDFTGHFRSRFQQLQKILMSRPELQKDLVSIGKISSERTAMSIIGIIKEKRITKNKNMILVLEDLTGEIGALVKIDKPEVFDKAEELQLDDIIGVRVSGNKDMLFVHEIYFPDSFIYEKVRFEEEVCVAFLSDVHCGSDRHLAENMNRFLEWINSDDATARKIKFIFFVGDNVDGVGIFPGQEEVLNLKSMYQQYDLLASYLRKIPKHIIIFMCPGQHDACRVAEPQPLISKKYAAPLYEIENLVLVTNPCLVKLLEKDKEFKVLMYHGASIHYFINEIKTLRLMKAHKCPARAVEEMLKRRHLAPTHSEVVYIPNSENDPLLISEVPDVLCTGEVHRLDIRNYNGVLIITGSCWQSQTPFEEKVGNIPDPAKVPVLNLKTRELKIFDFAGGEIDNEQ